ncbi:MAG: insulinase family protein [Phycisphaerales bacterium]|nr:insulinase family protein [Phycisphaerales bacterium]
MHTRFVEHTLPNGLRIVCEAMPRVSSAAIAMFVQTGSRHERPGEHGVSHFLEHMCFKGSHRRNCREINVRFDELGSIYNAFTGKEHTVYYGWVPADRVEPQLELLADLVRPALPAADFETERKVILEEIAMGDDAFERHVSNFLHHVIFEGHPLAHEILGDRETISTLPRETMAAYARERYAADNITLVATGAINPESVFAWAARQCGTWERSDSAAARATAAPTAAVAVDAVAGVADQPGCEVPPPSHSRTTPATSRHRRPGANGHPSASAPFTPPAGDFTAPPPAGASQPDSPSAFANPPAGANLSASPCAAAPWASPSTPAGASATAHAPSLGRIFPSPPPIPRSGVRSLRLPQFTQQEVMLVYPGPASGTPEEEDIETFASLFGGHNSRCYWNIVQKGIAAGAGAAWLAYGGCGAIVLWATGDPDRSTEMLSALRKEARRVMRDGFTSAEVQRVRNQRRMQLALESESPRTRVMQIIDDLETRNAPRTVGHCLAAVDQVTPAGVQRSLRKWPIDGEGLLVTVGPRG